MNNTEWPRYYEWDGIAVRWLSPDHMPEVLVYWNKGKRWEWRRWTQPFNVLDALPLTANQFSELVGSLVGYSI